MIATIVMGERIKRARTRQRLTQEELAVRLSVTKQAVSNWEKGKNRIDEGIKEMIEKELQISLKDSFYPGTKTSHKEKNLSEINNMDELMKCVDNIVDLVEVDQLYSVTVKSMLKKAMSVVLGYELYICHYIKGHEVSEWDNVGEGLEELLSVNDAFYNLKINPIYENMIRNKVKALGVVIGAELFEDFDEDGYREGYYQQIGNYGLECSYQLVDVIPERDNSIITVFKMAMLNLIDILKNIID